MLECGGRHYLTAEKLGEMAGTLSPWTLIIIGAVVVLLLAMVAIGERRWRAAGMDLDGRRLLPGESK